MSNLLSGWLLAPSVSTLGPDIDHLYNLVLLLTGVIFVLTEGTLVWFCLRYRAKPGQKAASSHGNPQAEMIWTAVPAAIMIALGIMSQNLWAKLRQPANFPEPEIVVKVMAEQWLWHFKYTMPDGSEIESQNDFHIPVGKKVRFELTSQDVIHGFYIPDLRINQDAVPGITSSVWAEATQTGQHELRCTQFCGTNHYQMKGELTVDTPEQFQAWLQASKASAF
jgi:cytochrome c oxidase subunit 2